MNPKEKAMKYFDNVIMSSIDLGKVINKIIDLALEEQAKQIFKEMEQLTEYIFEQDKVNELRKKWCKE